MANQIKIPKDFELFGTTIKVKINNELSDLDGNVGIFKVVPLIIELQKSNGLHPQDGVENTFFHELLHAIFHMMGKYELYKDEELIHTMAGLLHQSFKTAKYDA